MKMSAPSSGWPTREIELLMAEPRPENRPGIEPISVLVSGATTSEMPSPLSSTAGRTSMKRSTGGMRVDGTAMAACQAAESTGTRAHHSVPSAISNGPASRNPRGPRRPAIVPTRAESSVSRMPAGTPMAPAASAV